MTAALTYEVPTAFERQPFEIVCAGAAHAVDAAADPMIDAVATLLNVPLQHIYALLWRAGVLRIDE